MKNTKLLNIFLLKLMIIAAVLVSLYGCTTKAIRTQNFQGEINVSSLVVEFADINIVSDQNEESDIFDTIKRTQKFLQEMSELFDEEEALAVNAQLAEFQQTLIQQLKQRTGLPLVVVPDTAAFERFNTQSELELIEFSYPKAPGPALHLRAKITYPSQSELNVSAFEGAAEGRRLSVVPKITITLRGVNQNGDLFWRDSFSHTSEQSFIFADGYVLGVSADTIDDSDIFLIPLAQGL